MHKARSLKSPLLEKLSKRVPLRISLIVLFEMEWLTMNINPDRESTPAEWKKAHKWARKMTTWVLRDFKEWERNGRPK